MDMLNELRVLRELSKHGGAAPCAALIRPKDELLLRTMRKRKLVALDLVDTDLLRLLPAGYIRLDELNRWRGGLIGWIVTTFLTLVTLVVSIIDLLT